MKTIELKVITPCFCAGADQEIPDIRVSSIRGQLRWWFRKLYYSEMERAVFGGIGKSKNDCMASKVVIRVAKGRGFASNRKEILPHKTANSGFRNSIPEGSSFELQYLFRNGATTEQREAFEKALSAWMMLGSLGARGNRAAGSIWPAEKAYGEEKFAEKIKSLNLPKDWRIKISKGPDTVENLRKMASDTVNNDEFLGFAKGPRREGSPFKLKVVQLDSRYFLAAFAETDKVMNGALAALRNKRIGKPDFWRDVK